MKTYVDTKPCAQGELLIRKIDALPAGLKAMRLEDNKFIVGHSESGHHHTIAPQEGVEVFVADNDNMSLYLVVNNPKEECLLKHERDFNTHNPFFFGDGVYHIRRQIESSPEGYRLALD